jgi:DNA-binding MarR family transcriptional regulator
MNNELQNLIDLFLQILHLYSVIARKPKDYGTGDLIYVTELHTISMVGKNREINMTRLAEIMGVTKGAISQTISKLVKKGLITRVNTTNMKEVNLRLSEKGLLVYSKHESFHKEIFNFAESLYEKATAEDKALVKRLFLAISGNMQQRVKEL